MNSDYEKKVFIDTNDLSWENQEQRGVYKKILSCKESEETSLIKFEPDTTLNSKGKINSVEIFVLEGVYTNQFGDFEKGTYMYLPQEDEGKVQSKTGCVIFRKTNHFDDAQDIIVDTTSTQWQPGQGNLQVMPLGSQGALVKWPKDERFVPHRHWGGEEIFVLDGIFMDEHGKYPKGSWVRSPHMSEHYPFVEEETIIFVKTGHL